MNNKPMTEQDKTMNTMTALAICGVRTDPPTCEMIWRIREALTQKGEALTLGDIKKIQDKVALNHRPKEKSNLMVPMQK